MTQAPSLESSQCQLHDAGRGTDSQDGLFDQRSRLANSATGSSLGGRHIDREPFNSFGHSNNP